MKSIAILCPVFITLLLLLIAAYVFPPPKPNTLSRGDQVHIVDCLEATCWYKDCKEVTYLAGQALDNVDVVWLLVKGCPWYQYPNLDRVTTCDVVTMRSTDIKKVQ